ncbi:MAG TPA: aryl-sulfate sulfotransferase [Bryobacteraceae bacterium]|nr:aryl-sulfate sulfotransferase [Bryobacteraceae bacterium]
MTRSMGAVTGAVLALAAAIVLAAPSVYPTGTTIYDPGRAWNGFTVLSPLGTQAAIVIDMNGNIIKQWDGYVNSAGGPARVLPGGVIVGAAGANPPRQESLELVQRDFDGKVLWRFDHNEQIETRDGQTKEVKKIWAARQHHDWQRADFPAGYYSPEATPGIAGSNTLVLTHTNHIQPKVAPNAMLEDDRIIEISWDGKLLWEWVASDHIDEFHLDQDARKAITSAAGGNAGNGAGRGGGRGSFDWMHINSATYVGPNHWYDQGDQRFAPNNVIVSSRQASFLAIISRGGAARDGSVVWQLGPDFSVSPELRAIRQIIGQHHAHFIPKGLPGAGNVLVFDNGGPSGYGNPSPIALDGQNIYARPTSRVLEIDPVTLKLVWSYTSPTFFATNISGAQRLPNGNTLITEGPSGRVFEVTRDGSIIWEYVFPLFTTAARPTNSVYRAYRLPYGWIPQLARPKEAAVTPPEAGKFRVP